MPFFYSFDHLKVHYKTYGSGKPLLFLHGIPGNLDNWRHLVPLLEGEFLIVTLDLRGYGLSDKPEKFTMMDHVRDVLTLMEKLEIDPTEAFLIGHSYGTMVSLMLCSMRPVRGLVLISPPSELRKDITDFMILHFPSWIWKPLLFSRNAITTRLYRKLFFSPKTPPRIYEEFIQDNANYMNSLPVQSFKNPSTFEYRVEEYAGKVKTDVLVVVGSDDKIVPREDAKKVAEVLNAEFVEISNAGHMVLYEKPEELADAIRRFCLLRDG